MLDGLMLDGLMFDGLMFDDAALMPDGGAGWYFIPLAVFVLSDCIRRHRSKLTKMITRNQSSVQYLSNVPEVRSQTIRVFHQTCGVARWLTGKSYSSFSCRYPLVK